MRRRLQGSGQAAEHQLHGDEQAGVGRKRTRAAARLLHTTRGSVPPKRLGGAARGPGELGHQASVCVGEHDVPQNCVIHSIALRGDGGAAWDGWSGRSGQAW